jgi:hypothetical protein
MSREHRTCLRISQGTRSMPAMHLCEWCPPLATPQGERGLGRGNPRLGGNWQLSRRLGGLGDLPGRAVDVRCQRRGGHASAHASSCALRGGRVGPVGEVDELADADGCPEAETVTPPVQGSFLTRSQSTRPQPSRAPVAGRGHKHGQERVTPAHGACGPARAVDLIHVAQKALDKGF